MTSLEDMLKVETSSYAKKPAATEFTRDISIAKNTAEATVRAPEGTVNEGTGLKFLEEEKLNPADWEVTHFRKIKYGEGMESVKFTYRRIGGSAGADVPIAELAGLVRKHRPKAVRAEGDYGFIVALGDTQFGKVDGDGAQGALSRTLAYLDDAADVLATLRKRFDIGHIHIAWLGDHVEGFLSQGGANTWRTPLTLSEQIRLTRRVMLYSVELFASSAQKVTVAAVPGNHGETVRIAGKGQTRYDDSHDTEALVAVSEACAMAPKTFGHVEFFVPQKDEMTVTLPVAGTVVSHVHGHQFRPGQHFKWWAGQSFGNSPLADANLLLAGHLHHELVEANGQRTFIQVPSLEAESTWYRHATGVTGNPGIIAAVTKDGRVSPIEIVR